MIDLTFVQLYLIYMTFTKDICTLYKTGPDGLKFLYRQFFFTF